MIHIDISWLVTAALGRVTGSRWVLEVSMASLFYGSIQVVPLMLIRLAQARR